MRTSAEQSPTRSSTSKKTAPKAAKASPLRVSAAKKPAAKASAAQKSAAKKSAAAAAQADSTPSVYILADMVLRHGPATPDEVFTLVVRDRQSLIFAGAQVATPRISTDAARIYGRAADILKSATAAQKRALRGLSADFLRIAIWSAQHGKERHEQRRLADSAGASRQEQRQAQGQVLRQQATARRDQLETLLRLACGGNTQQETDIERAYGRIGKPEELAQALTELVALGQTYLTSSDPELKRRAASAGLDAAYLTECTALAQRAGDQLKTAEATREAPVLSQADIDLWDGVNLYLLERTIALFEVANQLEPTVPRLLLMSLRSRFGRTAKKAKLPKPPQSAT